MRSHTINALCRPAFENFWNLKHIRNKLVLFEAVYCQGKEGYEPNLKISQGVEMVDALKIRGYAAAPLQKIFEKVRLSFSVVNALSEFYCVWYRSRQ